MAITERNAKDEGLEPPYEPPSLHEETVGTGLPTDRVVFGVAAGLMVAFIAWGVLASDSLSDVASTVLDGVITGGGWAFVLTASGFVVFALWLALSSYGKVPLGRDDELPEF